MKETVWAEFSAKELIAYCGVDCSVCPDYTDQRCPGCRKSEWPEGDACLPVACCQERDILFCGQCPQFPCGEMREFYAESEGHQQAYRLMCRLREAGNPVSKPSDGLPDR